MKQFPFRVPHPFASAGGAAVIALVLATAPATAGAQSAPQGTAPIPAEQAPEVTPPAPGEIPAPSQPADPTGPGQVDPAAVPIPEPTDRNRVISEAPLMTGIQPGDQVATDLEPVEPGLDGDAPSDDLPQMRDVFQNGTDTAADDQEERVERAPQPAPPAD